MMGCMPREGHHVSLRSRVSRVIERLSFQRRNLPCSAYGAASRLLRRPRGRRTDSGTRGWLTWIRDESGEQAAEADNAPAMCNLGVCYEEGRGVEESGVDAHAWYARAAQFRHAEAQYRLARLFRCVTAMPCVCPYALPLPPPCNRRCQTPFKSQGSVPSSEE